MSHPALRKYLRLYCDPRSEGVTAPAGHWEQVLIIPCYRESAALADHLCSHIAPDTLIIVVLNQPDTATTDANAELRLAIQQAACNNLLLIDAGALPAAQGVGLARKIGCDAALRLMQEGRIRSTWLHTTDADCELPRDYFQAVTACHGSAACVHPFQHTGSSGDPVFEATKLYELRLHYYVRGLAFAGSPYAFHTLGSCISVQGDHYAMVRGFPRRNAAEDFYLLNKVAKTGPVSRARHGGIRIRARLSDRVPFGTGPAALALQDDPTATPFYHPAGFEALRQVLRLRRGEPWQQQLRQQLPAELANATVQTLTNMSLDRALHHCEQHSSEQQGFQRHFYQWLDGFRSLKFIHAIRDAGWPNHNLETSRREATQIWPAADSQEQLLQLCRNPD